MISATALNASTVPLNKSPQMPLGLDNSRLRVDSQKFLVPSLPVSSRQINPRPDPHHHQQPSPHHHHQHNPHSLHYQQHNGGGAVEAVNKRRSIHPISPVENRGMSVTTTAHHNHLNGNYAHQHRRSSSPLGLNGRGTSPNYNHAYMQSSPRKDAHSPMYAGEVPGYSESPGGGSTFSARSSVPIPCSSPSPGTSASPKSSVSHSLSPSSQSGYPPHLPPSANGASELSQLAVAAAAAAAAASGNHRLYPPGFPPPSAAAAHHAAYLAAAAAAAGHSLPYPSLFGSPHYPQSHQHPHGSAAAAASSYLDFHSKLLRNSAAAVAAVAASADIRSPSQSPPSARSSSASYQSNSSSQQQQQHHNHNILQPMGSPQSTSVTSLHTKLIESVSAAGDRYHPHHHSSSHNHVNNQTRFSSSSSSSSSSSTSPSNGVSKGGPLGISGGIMGLTIAPNSNTNSPHKGHSGPVATSATPEMSSKSTTKLYMEHPGLPGNNIGNRNSESQERKLLAEMELINGRDSKATKEAIMLAKQRMLTRSPENYSTSSGRHHHLINQQHHSSSQEQKSTANVKSISFASDAHSGGIHRQPYINGHASHSHPHQHHSLHSHQHSGGGPTNLSTDPKKSAPTNQAAISNFHQQNHMFLPPSPKKRSAPCNFAVPQSPSSSGGKVVDLLPPPPPPSDSHYSDRESSSAANLQHNLSPSSKYLSPNQHHHQQQQHHHHPQSQQMHQKPSNGNVSKNSNDDFLNAKSLHRESSGNGGRNIGGSIGSANLKEYYFPFYNNLSPFCNNTTNNSNKLSSSSYNCVTPTYSSTALSSYPYTRHQLHQHQLQMLHSQRFNSSSQNHQPLLHNSSSSTCISSGGPDARAAASSSAGLADGSHHPHHHPQHHQNYHSSNAQQLLVVPNSPLSTNSSSSSHGGSGPSTPKSPSVHFRFFGGAQNKENSVVATGTPGRNGRILNARNDSSSSTSSVELGVNGRGRQSIGGTNGGGPWPVEQMPLISAFRKGSLIKLASGDLKAVEEMREEDFEKAVMMTNSVRIVYCHVIAIQPIPDSQLCKVTLAMGAAQNQQVGTINFFLNNFSSICW